MDARAGADVDDVIRRAHGILVMLHDQDGVSQIAQMAKRIEQLVVVALVKPDRRLVEDIKNAHEAGADLGGQTDSLALAAGQGSCRARERQIPSPDRLQKPNSSRDRISRKICSAITAMLPVSSVR